MALTTTGSGVPPGRPQTELLHDVHSFLTNFTAELENMRDGLDRSEMRQQKACDDFRKELEHEELDCRESMNKFRYEFDELVHKRIETVLEGLEEMEQSQKYKDRQQQAQINTIEGEVKGLRHHLGLVSSHWTALRTKSQNRKPLSKKQVTAKKKVRKNLREEIEQIKTRTAQLDMYSAVEVMRVRIKSSCQFINGNDWIRGLKLIDKDNSGLISCDEFISYCNKELKLVESKEQIQMIFDCMDADHSGEIAIDELIEFVSDPAQRMAARLKREVDIQFDGNWNTLMAEIDSDGSGSMDYPEFVHLCRAGLKLLDKDMHLHHVFDKVDVDRSGEITVKELLTWIDKMVAEAEG